MAKWGDGYRWGGGTKWGAGETGVVSDPFSGDVVWIVNIDWTGTGATNEADYLRGYDLKRGREHNIQPQGTGFEQMQKGRVTLVMDNANGRFDPYNTASPLYPNVLPGRRIQILVYDVATKTTYVRFTGHITDIQPSSGINEVTITASDGMQWLADASYSSAVTYSKTISEAIDLVLSFVNWPYQRNIQASVQPLQVFEPRSGNALSIIQDLAEANLGTFFADRFGKACFYPISYTTTTTHTIDQSVALREIRVPQPWETVRNRIQVIANRRGKRPGSVIWTLPGIESFTAGQVKTFGTSFNSSDGLMVETLTANTVANGSGTNVSGNFSIGRSNTTATECTLTITNNSGATAYLIALRLVGSEIVSAPENMTATDATSITNYGPRQFVLDNQWLQDRAYATAYATILKDFFKDPHKDPIIQIQQRPTVQYPIDLYDKVALTSSKLGINATYTVGGLEEKWMSDTGQDAVTTLYLQTVLYDTTDITPDPFYPGALDYGSLPDLPFPDMPYWFDPYTPSDPFNPGNIIPDPTNACLAVGAFGNGPIFIKPVATPSVNLSPTNLTHIMYYPCTLRPANALNKSYIAIHMDSFTGGNPTWSAYFTTNFMTVTAIDAGGADVCNSTLTAGTNGGNIAYAWFMPSSAIEVAGFKITILDPGSPSDNSYRIGSVIKSGSIIVTTEYGTSAFSAVAGNYYAVQTTGGPWTYDGNPAHYSYRTRIRLDGYVGGLDSGGLDWGGYVTTPLNNYIVAGEEQYGGASYSLTYLKCSVNSTLYLASLTETPSSTEWASHTGSLDYILYDAYPPLAKKMIYIYDAAISNVCATGIL